ncbi:MAG: hypothetical protein H6644_09295 [Caldilineaceae bacterium]|nr:hypothetical protein [Caldilineaceae bacterium]
MDRRNHTATEEGGHIVMGRLAWLIVTLLLLVNFVSGMRPRYAELSKPCAAAPCPYYAVHPTEATILADAGVSLRAYAGFHLLVELTLAGALTVLAFIIFWRGPRTWSSVLLALTLSLFGLSFMVETDGVGFLTRNAVSPWNRWIGGFGGLMFVYLLYLVPDGRFVPARARYLLFLLTAMVALDPLLAAPVDIGGFSGPLYAIFIVCLITGLAAQIYRYRNVSSPRQRQQTKWILLGLTILVACMIFYALVYELFPLSPGPRRLALFTVAYAGLLILLMVFPIAVVFSILQYRLWDVDLVINRALVYTMLTVVLAAVYFGSVILFQRITLRVTGTNSDLAVVLSTLLIAALFSPVRRRVQDSIDRRFFRRKYDAQQALSGFAQLTRSQVDLDEMHAALIDVAEQTVQPETVSLWFKEQS